MLSALFVLKCSDCFFETSEVEGHLSRPLFFFEKGHLRLVSLLLISLLASAMQRPPCSGAVASTSAAAALLRPAPVLPSRRRRSSNSIHHRRPQPSSSSPPSSSPLPAAASPSSTPYTPPEPINYFDSDAFSASPPPPESRTRPAYNRYRATVDIERSTVQGWEEVVPSAGDPDWRPPPVDFRSLAAYPIPWLRFKILPPHLTFVIAEVWNKVVLPISHRMRRTWVVSVAAAVDRKVFGKARRRKERAAWPAAGSSSDENNSPSSSFSFAPASSLSILELALQRWHGKRSPLDDLGEWVLALRGK